MHQNHSNWVHGQIWDTPTFKTTVMWEYKHALFADPPLAQFFASLDRGTKPSEKIAAIYGGPSFRVERAEWTHKHAHFLLKPNAFCPFNPFYMNWTRRVTVQAERGAAGLFTEIEMWVKPFISHVILAILMIMPILTSPHIYLQQGWGFWLLPQRTSRTAPSPPPH